MSTRSTKSQQQMTNLLLPVTVIVIIPVVLAAIISCLLAGLSLADALLGSIYPLERLS